MLTEDVFTHASIKQASRHRTTIEAEHRACIEPASSLHRATASSQHRAFSIEHRGRGSELQAARERRALLVLERPARSLVIMFMTNYGARASRTAGASFRIQLDGPRSCAPYAWSGAALGSSGRPQRRQTRRAMLGPRCTVASCYAGGFVLQARPPICGNPSSSANRLTPRSHWTRSFMRFLIVLQFVMRFDACILYRDYAWTLDRHHITH